MKTRPAWVLGPLLTALSLLGCKESSSPALLFLELNSRTLEFPQIPASSSRDLSVVVRNSPTSTDHLELEVAVSGEGFIMVSGGGEVSLAPGETHSVLVRFTPPRGGAFSGAITLSHNGTNEASPLSIPLAGTGEPAVLLGTPPTPVAFGAVTVGQIKDRSFTLSNSPDSPHALTGTVDAQGPGFAIRQGGGAFSLPPGETKAVEIRFSPVDTGEYSGTLSIAHNGRNYSSPTPVPLVGSGRPAIDLVLSSPSIAFGPVTLGEVSYRTLDFENSSDSKGILTANLEVQGPGLSLAEDEASMTLYPGENTSVEVRFSPAGSGPQTGAISVTHNATNLRSPLLIPVRGEGMPTIHLLVRPSSLRFDSVPIGQSLERTLSITNAPTSTGTLTGWVESSGEAFSRLPGDREFSLPPGASHTVTVSFSPPQSGLVTGALSIHHNGTESESPHSVPLSGTDERTTTYAGNPLFWGADPSGHVWADGKMWIYPTTDAADWTTVSGWNAWSSEDLKNWTLHEDIFGADDCGWCRTNPWASDIAFKNGKYFLYYYFFNDGSPIQGIGVAESDNPEGPFTNRTPLGPLVTGHDPCVFIDDDGQAYLFQQTQVFFLAEDMISIQEEDGREKVQEVEFLGHEPIVRWEAVWVFKREGRYYLSLADDEATRIRYFMSDRPTGPYVYAGTLLPRFDDPVHHSIVQFGDRWILWYHVWDQANPGQRRVQGEYISFNADGTIQPVGITDDGVSGGL